LVYGNAGAILLTTNKSEAAALPAGDITPETAGEWLSMLAQVTGYAVTLTDAKRRIVWANDAFSELTGYGPEECIGRTPSELLQFDRAADPEKSQRIRDGFRAVRGVRFEIRVRGKDGHEWWLNTDARPLRDSQGAHKGWVCIHADVTTEVLEREALRRNENRARMMIQGGNIATWEWDTRTTLVETNPVYMTMLGYPPDDCWHTVEWLRSLCHPDDLSMCDRGVQEILEGTRSGFQGHSRLRARDGSWRWVFSSGGVLERGADGAATRIFCVMFDVTEHKLADEQNRVVSERLALIAQNVPGMIFQWRMTSEGKGEFVYVSPGVRAVYGVEPEVLMKDGRALASVTHPQDFERERVTMLHSAQLLRPWHLEHRVLRADGTITWAAGEALPRREKDGSTIFDGYVSDVTAGKVSEQRISFLAYHDGLTGLENRLGLRSKLDEMLLRSRRSGTSLALLMIDLDRFKHVNDNLGHDVGDELLVEIARRLRSTVRECDLVARLGGDEFVLVLDDLPDEAHVSAAVQKLFRHLRGNFRLSGGTVYTTCSIGISRFPKDGADSSTLLKHADLAMYTAKANGGDSYRLFENDMRPGTDRLILEVELRDALERNELELYYQPRIDTLTGRPTAIEALLRWRHPIRGLVLPTLFIPIAEETGLIESIGQWVLERACHDLRAWLDSGGEPLRVSVNLSPVQFAREELPDRVAAALQSTQLPAELLELEITETVAMRSPELAARHLALLRALGVSLAIDDFGTGHSSLSRLKLLNVDCVKIDRSLVEDCSADPHDAALCRAAIALGLALGLEVVAEGVETQDQRQFLAQEHCSTIQGYLVAPAMPAGEAFSFVRSLLEVPRLRSALAK
jgi:diguanylate cyclase (GGDEF)-like protein/PAS domain S-box-containing protein